MHPERLGPLLVERTQGLLDSNRSATDSLLEFVGVVESTLATWLKPSATYPQGERLNRLWHFLRAAGCDSPELDRVPEFGAYVGKLLAYGVIELQHAKEYCGVTNDQTVLRIIRGEQEPSQPQQTLDNLKEVHEASLRDKLENLRRSLRGVSVPSAVEAAPAVSQKSVGGVNDASLLEVAGEIARVAPYVRYAAELSPEEKAELRRFVGPQTLFEIATLMNRLNGSRADNEGR